VLAGGAFPHSGDGPAHRELHAAQGDAMTTIPRTDTPAAGDYGDAFPNSSKVYVGGRHGIRVPMREIALSGGEPPLRVYDTSGPLGGDVRQGLPSVRGEWIAARDVSSVARSYTPIAGRSTAELPASLARPTLRGTGAVTQMAYARGAARSRPRWSSWRCARGCRRSWCATRWRAGGPSSPPTSTTPSWSR